MSGAQSEDITPLAGASKSSLPGPGISALAAALSNSLGTSPMRHGTPPLRALSPATAGAHIQASEQQSTYGSFDTRSRSVQGAAGWTGPGTFEDAEIVKRHLVQPTQSTPADGAADSTAAGGVFAMQEDTASTAATPVQDAEVIAPGLNDDEFSSLRLQGGDVTRPIYRWTEEQARGRTKRSKSFNLSGPEDIGSIKVPGGFRRDYLRRAAGSPSPEHRDVENAGGGVGTIAERRGVTKPRLFTNNFIEFLTIYGHFAGEELEEDDEALAPGEYFGEEYFTSSDVDDYLEVHGHDDSDDEDREPMESSALLTPGRRKRLRKTRGGSGKNGTMGAILLLLKSFVGTGVLFLPRAYLNGGMMFSNVILLLVASLSYYCFVLLVNSRLAVDGSYGDIGGKLYGRWFRNVILFSIVLSQIGFVAAYIVFTSENLQAFILAVSNCKTFIDIKFIILMQVAVFLPLSLIRDISKLGATALIADALIMLGLIYLYYYDIFTIVKNGGVSDIVQFNPNDWTSFIGTAIFTFEGIGKSPNQICATIPQRLTSSRSRPTHSGIHERPSQVPTCSWSGHGNHHHSLHLYRRPILRRLRLEYRDRCPAKPSARRQNGQRRAVLLFRCHPAFYTVADLPRYPYHRE